MSQCLFVFFLFSFVFFCFFETAAGVICLLALLLPYACGGCRNTRKNNRKHRDRRKAQATDEKNPYSLGGYLEISYFCGDESAQRCLPEGGIGRGDNIDYWRLSRLFSDFLKLRNFRDFVNGQRNDKGHIDDNYAHISGVPCPIGRAPPPGGHAVGALAETLSGVCRVYIISVWVHSLLVQQSRVAKTSESGTSKVVPTFFIFSPKMCTPEAGVR